MEKIKTNGETPQTDRDALISRILNGVEKIISDRFDKALNEGLIEEKPMTSADLMKWLDISQATLQRRVDNREIPCHRATPYGGNCVTGMWLRFALSNGTSSSVTRILWHKLEYAKKSRSLPRGMRCVHAKLEVTVAAAVAVSR